MIPRLEENDFQWKTLEKRRYLKFSSGAHAENFIVSATFFTERKRVLHGNISDSRPGIQKCGG